MQCGCGFPFRNQLVYILFSCTCVNGLYQHFSEFCERMKLFSKPRAGSLDLSLIYRSVAVRSKDAKRFSLSNYFSF